MKTREMLVPLNGNARLFAVEGKMASEEETRTEWKARQTGMVRATEWTKEKEEESEGPRFYSTVRWLF